MNKFNIIISVLLLVVVVDLAYLHTATQRTTKIGVVQMEELVYAYDGMKEATDQYAKKLKGWQSQTDTLESKLNALVDEIKLDSINEDYAKLAKDQQRFIMLRNSYFEYKNKIKERAQKDDQETTVGVLNQLNGYIKTYAEKKGYDVIIANTQLQNVNYVRTSKDVTEEVLEFANAKYNGEE